MGACDSLTSSTKLYSRFLASDADKVVIFYFLLFVPYMVRQHRAVVKSIFSANVQLSQAFPKRATLREQ
jgi:hypothetical protein